MRKIYIVFVFIIISFAAFSQGNQVRVQQLESGMKLQVDGKDFMVNGMNWDYFPIGTNYSYSLWNQPDDIIQAALDTEMSLLKNMGVNTIRVYTGIPPRWIKYIYENYGIYTMLNHAFGRYGLEINGAFVVNTDYSDARTRELLLKEVRELADTYKNTPGLLLYLLGNENNYGLFWDGAETEDIPVEDRKSTQRALAMYQLFNEGTLAMKAIDTNHPIAICNGDLLFIEIIQEACKDIDIFGTNMYRGMSFSDAFQRVRVELNKPILFTEFGSDAFNAVSGVEDQEAQAKYLLNNWKEIYENAEGFGKAGNSLGGFTFQFSDGWWKFWQTKNLDVHDANASWANGGYTFDFQEGENNMNEEWFGICAKGPTNPRGLYDLYPRAAYYALQKAHQINPYAEGVTLASVQEHFNSILVMDAVLKARGDQAALQAQESKMIRLSEMRAELTTFITGGELTITPEDPDPNSTTFPDRQGFDYMQSFFVGVEARPTENVRANVTFNVLGNVATNPINEIFYENRGRPTAIPNVSGNSVQTALNRVQVYQADYSWEHEYFSLDGFFRTGHYHWGYEGDFFGLYPEANYGPNLDIYNGNAPNGVEIAGKKELKGFKLAFGPELWWGGNPALLLKYSREVGGFGLTGIYHEDLDEPRQIVTSIAVPQPRTRRVTLHVDRQIGKFKAELGGIWGGQPLVGRSFQLSKGSEGNYQIFTDEVKDSDTWGGKLKLTYSSGRLNWYASAASMGLVANGSPDPTQTFTGWRLKDSGSGNQNNVLTGLTVTMGKLQVAPNFLWQKPLVDPMPNDVSSPGRLRNILDDPFVVINNRETVGGELLLTFDPTPGTWMYEWDNDRKEDAKFATSVGFAYRHHPTSHDANIVFPGTGRVPTAADGAPPALDIWEVYGRIVSKVDADLGIIVNWYGGNGQARGSDPRPIERGGGDLRILYKNMKLNSHVKVNDWGPYDYHRDFNLTFPLQLMADISTSVGKQDWYILPSTQLGIRFTWRSLDENSPRYLPNASIPPSNTPIISPVGFDNGNEWELRTYVHFNIGK
ncbi:glycosidase [Persicobacter diffluens]|uniref:Glycosidase n=1 Tax=Persicobacter diffluens TaxID=981 RepID=A0AAN4VZJ7_9BACT|nr:hypothetical protein PEDI_35360 [Persicobacter diffluens]